VLFVSNNSPCSCQYVLLGSCRHTPNVKDLLNPWVI
jgi:hypothetical protein